MTYIPEEFKDLSIKDDVCPVYTYLENLYLYKYINVAKEVRLFDLSFAGRIVIEAYKQYMSLRK